MTDTDVCTHTTRCDCPECAPCPWCNGTGAVPERDPEVRAKADLPCDQCGGSGSAT
ncbi:hypothetical protein ATK17_3973 [Branchiibius hedensis]|uniref:Molecular chaperone DnaJ n=1 Tax=Branchiibius hedensis TaxID=672460 RepID=A0A2Y9BN46_9MICO|nr:hypothetical protein ATK17_3973 [Branchiibius hedensis]SSA59153.1 hypothetical protein SAMN04489750_3973 [Branchiibius hedensis]